jgi:hypothetical protein
MNTDYRDKHLLDVTSSEEPVMKSGAKDYNQALINLMKWEKSMKIEDLSKPLSIQDIDFRIQSINKGGYATILAYKDARVDQQRLDDVCTPLGWKREHTRDNHNCIVSIWDKENAHWVSKEDTGTESNTEQQKGLASDSFKRACFNWGIGRELYDYPQISVKLNANEVDLTATPRPKATWNLKLKEWMWSAKFEDGVLSYLSAIDEKGKTRYQYGEPPRSPASEIKAEVVNQDHVNGCYAMLKEEIDADEEGRPNVDRMKKGFGRLNNSEQIVCLDKFEKTIPEGSKRMYRNIINDYLKQKEGDE